MRVKRTERGWAGHFICGDRCLFRRNTLIECGGKKIVVSTVGNMRTEGEVAETIGCDRYYETMAFEAIWVDPYWEADVGRQLEFKSNWALSEVEYETDLKADAMHEAVVKELSRSIK